MLLKHLLILFMSQYVTLLKEMALQAFVLGSSTRLMLRAGTMAREMAVFFLWNLMIVQAPQFVAHFSMLQQKSLTTFCRWMKHILSLEEC